jgi:hypothetical protein
MPTRQRTVPSNTLVRSIVSADDRVRNLVREFFVQPVGDGGRMDSQLSLRLRANTDYSEAGTLSRLERKVGTESNLQFCAVFSVT